jgi:hypothetical protein
MMAIPIMAKPAELGSGTVPEVGIWFTPILTW